MRAPRGLPGVLSSRESSIIYGWPTVIIVDRNHQPKVAPLFAVQVEPGQTPENEWRLHATMEPEFNLAVTASGLFDPSITEDISDLLGDGLPFGDAVAFAELAARTADLLGLEILSPLNAGVLESNIGRQQGVHNAAVAVVAEWSGYTSALREELRQLRTREDWSTTAAAYLVPVGLARKEGGHRQLGPLAAPLSCNQSQEDTLERLRRDPLTIVTGPPGTGKTQLVVNAVTNAWLDGDRVLVTSTNNGAVDVAAVRAEEVSSGLLIRTGNRSEREQVPDRVTVASAGAAAERGRQAGARTRLKQAAAKRSDLVESLARLDELDLTLLHALEKRKELSRALEEAARTLWSSASAPDLPMGSGEADRRARRLLRAWWFRRYRARRLLRWLGCPETALLGQVIAWARVEQRLTKLASLVASGRAERQRLQSAVGDPSTSLREADRQWADGSLRAIRAETATRISSGADQLASFSRIAASGNPFKKAVSNSFDSLRGWACTALAAQSSFPLAPALFDLVIVDEASQCSLAAVLPLAYRAKRLAVVGDPHQLNPIVQLSDGLMQQIASQTGFDNDDLRERGIHHKDGSAYSAFESAARPGKPVLLNEHYRCHPHIARWFNRTFYGGELVVLTQVSETSQSDRAIYWCDVEGEAVRPASGSWRNEVEAQQTVLQLRGLVDSGYRTVGVVTPFAAQAQRIGQLARAQFGEDFLDEIDFVSGTAHRLQGDERDAIVLSSVLSPGMSDNGARWVEKERNLLNVAVSRARRALVVLGHPRMGDLGSPTLASLRAYLHRLRDDVALNQGDVSASAEFRTDSTSERLLLDAMQLGALLPYAKLQVEGYELDFALLDQGVRLNIEVDGDQHFDGRGRQRRQDTTRDRVLEGLGWTVLRIPAWRCHAEMDSVIEDIRTARARLLEGTSG